jgi:hypothetical protein
MTPRIYLCQAGRCSCLGAALIMQWNTLPTKLQRDLFDKAGTMGELLDTTALRGQIARFLHKRKDDGDAGQFSLVPGREAGCASSTAATASGRLKSAERAGDDFDQPGATACPFRPLVLDNHAIKVVLL